MAGFRAAVAEQYSIERELGEGGMAVVYLAHDRKHDRRVAVKVLRPEIAVGVGAERFVREIQVVARLQHPHILPLFDSGVAAELPYYVAPYVEGESLRARLRRERQLGLEEALAITRQVASALDYAHLQGVVHRDIKPDNILFFADGEAAVADFGIALAFSMAGGDTLTQAGQIIGTPAYMSPEQAAGTGTVDGRADVYSLACMVYEMLAGEPPFSSPTPQATIARQLHDTPPSLEVLRPAVPPPVRDAVARALAKVPADRYPTAAAFVDALSTAEASTSRAGWRRGLAVAALVLVGLGGYGVVRRIVGRSEFNEGMAAFRSWDVAEAQRHFAAATRTDPGNAQAQYYLAQAGALLDRPADEWRTPAALAARGAAALGDWKDSMRAIALRALGEGQYPAACVAYRSVLARDSSDALSWFGLGECQRLDSIVVRVRESPPVWHFRGSYEGAFTAYLQALEWAPTLGFGFAAKVDDRMASILITDPQGVRFGRSLEPDSGMYWGWPGLDHDTIVFLPTPQSGAINDPPTHAEAVARGRDLLREAALRWVREFPGDPAAHARLARALEDRGELVSTGDRRSAVGELDQALRLQPDERARIPLRLARIRLDLKLGNVAAARSLADSVLRGASHADIATAQQLACAAALVGRAHLAADLMAMTASDSSYAPPFRPGDVPGSVAAPAMRLWVYAAFGAPVDSLESLAQQTDLLVARWVLPAKQDVVLRRALELPAFLAFPSGALRRWLEYSPTIDVKDVQWSVARGDTAHARRRLSQMQRLEATFDVASLMPTQVYEEAVLAVAVRDTAAAEWRLGRVLDNLPATSWRIVAEPQQAATLVRAMALRSQLATARGDTATARRWAAAVATLWSGADLPELRALVDSLRVF